MNDEENLIRARNVLLGVESSVRKLLDKARKWLDSDSNLPISESQIVIPTKIFCDISEQLNSSLDLSGGKDFDLRLREVDDLHDAWLHRRTDLLTET